MITNDLRDARSYFETESVQRDREATQAVLETLSATCFSLLLLAVVAGAVAVKVLPLVQALLARLP